MKLNVYSIFDSVASVYNTPFFMQNDGVAVRAFANQLNENEESQLSKHPQDFTLWHIGEYDDSNAQLTPLKTPKRIATGFELKQERTEVNPHDLYQEIKKLVNKVDPDALEN